MTEWKHFRDLAGIDQAVEAANRARERLGDPTIASAPPAPVGSDPIDRVREWARHAPALAMRGPSAEQLEASDRAKVEALCSRVIPGGRRQWARFEHPDLALRVPSKAAIAASRTAVGEPYVVWTGGSGRGKTALACAALRARIESGCTRPLYVAAWRLAVARARHPLGEGEPEIVNAAMRAELLLLDELGDQHQATSAVPDVIYERESEGLPTWITTWMTAHDVTILFGSGIARRIFERAVIIDCGGT